MPKSDKAKRTKLSPAQQEARASLIADQLEKQLSDPNLSDAVICRNMTLNNRTFYRIKPRAQAILDARLKDRASKVAAATTTVAIRESLKGVKTRHERILILQDEIEAIRAELKRGKDIGFVIVNGKKKKVVKSIDLSTRAYLRRTIKELQAEISKIEGDYAPEKRELEVTTPIENDIDYDSLTDEELDLIIKIGQKKLKAPQ